MKSNQSFLISNNSNIISIINELELSLGLNQNITVTFSNIIINESIDNQLIEILNNNNIENNNEKWKLLDILLNKIILSLSKGT